MKNSAKASPPSGLSAESKRLWTDLIATYEIDDEAGLLILRTALEARDRMQAARAEIRRKGMTYFDRFGQEKASPLLVVERDSRSGMLAALKQLALDLEPLQPRPGRPGGR